MNTYDAALPKGREAGEGHEPRIRHAAPGSALDHVYAGRYSRVIEDDAVAVEFTSDPTPSGAAVVEAVAQAIADETPPEARRKARRSQ